MPKKILILQGHPDPSARHFGHALAGAYEQAAAQAGHQLRTVDIATLDYPLLRSKAEWETGGMPIALKPVADGLQWCEHLLLCFPLWLGGVPAFTRGVLEQVLRPGFAVSPMTGEGFPSKLLAGRSARVLVTMGMPALVYRWYFRAHSIKALERNILGFVGFSPVQETLIGQVEGMSDAQRQRCLAQLASLGRKGV